MTAVTASPECGVDNSVLSSEKEQSDLPHINPQASADLLKIQQFHAEDVNPCASDGHDSGIETSNKIERNVRKKIEKK
ncbi:MAG: hypothetical protein ACPGUD_12390 [Parashewanella sp.]